MKKIIFIILCSTIISGFARSQAITELVKQVNLELAKAVFDAPPNNYGICYSDPPQISCDIIWYKTIYKIKLYANGSLNIYKSSDRYLIPAGTNPEKIESTIPIYTKSFQENNYYVKLNELDETIEIISEEVSDPCQKSTYTLYTVVLHCQNNDECISNTNMGSKIITTINIPIINENYAKIIKEAFEDLIKQVSENPDF